MFEPHHPALSLRTTGHANDQELASANATSVATAQASRLAALAMATYPEYWPETVRAVITNGASYTPAMGARLDMSQRERETLVGRYGYGRVVMESSLNSQLRRPTIVLQETLVPYVLDGTTSKLGKVNIHKLPWPARELEQLEGARVALKITLSYFVQPNPSRRGWQSKFRYQSHGLRFAVRASVETEERFAQRINRIKRDEMGDEREDSMPDPDGPGWLPGTKVRSRGSLHSDTWFGTAQQLANKSEIAVFPVGGWWKEMGRAIEAALGVRYALVVSLEVMMDADVDIYTPIANEIGITVENR
jgi:hypothetical protein